MKKNKAFIMTLFLSVGLTLAACGNSQNAGAELSAGAESNTVIEETSDSSEELDELLATAIELDGYTFYKEYDSNKVKVSSQYEGTACLVEGTIDEIESDHIAVVDSNLKVNVYLPTEEIIELEKDQFVQVVGILENLDLEQNMSLVYVTADFNTGYLANVIYTRSGEYNSYNFANSTHPSGLSLTCINENGNFYCIELVLTDEQKDALTAGTEVTLEGKLLLNDSNKPYSAKLKMIVSDIK